MNKITALLAVGCLISLGAINDSASGVELVQDGGFEAGTPNPFWTEASTNFGTPLCTVAACGTGGGTGPASGTWWAWFGGIAGFEQGQLVQQTMTFPVGTATLSFDYEKPVVDTSTADLFEVRVDGNVVFSDNGGGGAFVGYVNQSVNLDTFADGNTHSLEFFSQVFGNNLGVTNFFVDNVSIEGVPEPSGLALLALSGLTLLLRRRP
jgi:hypothetical protein